MMVFDQTEPSLLPNQIGQRSGEWPGHALVLWEHHPQDPGIRVRRRACLAETLKQPLESDASPIV
jgi:hypothetical protein